MKFNKSEVFEKFLGPLNPLYINNVYARSCPQLEDESWIKVGIQRTLSDMNSGRGFLEKLIIDGSDYLSCDHYFESLKSERRLRHCQELNKQLLISINTSVDARDPFKDFPELAGFDLYAGDGHSHKAPIHEIKIDNKKFETQHFYRLCMRGHTMSHMTLALYGGTRKKEHDMHAIKRLDIDELRNGAKKGQKVLYVWDKAGIDFAQWQKWKNQGGVYFLSEEKELNRLLVIGEPYFDKEDPVNAGVLKYETVSSANGISIFRVTYECPETGKIFKFLTNLPRSIRPGVIAHLYRTRWDIERKYNLLKHKLYERRAWANTPTAKTMQANFICLTHNLTLIFSQIIEPEVDVTAFDIQRRESRAKEAIEKIEKLGKKAAPHVFNTKRVTELPKKLFAWIRSWVFKVTPWEKAIENLKLLFRSRNYTKAGQWIGKTTPQDEKFGENIVDLVLTPHSLEMV